MLGIGSNKNQAIDASSVNLIANGTRIIGDIFSAQDVRIDGQLNGNIVTSGKFVLGPNGLIEGNVTSENADIMGEIKGNVKIAEMLSLKSTSKISGDIITGKLSIEPGALFTGSCNMGAKVKNMVQNTDQLNVKSKTA